MGEQPRRLIEVIGGIGVALLVALTVATVPLVHLGAWAAGTLLPVVVIGALVCVRSWPWARGEVAGDLEAVGGDDPAHTPGALRAVGRPPSRSGGCSI